MGQISMKIISLPGSLLSANQQQGRIGTVFAGFRTSPVQSGQVERGGMRTSHEPHQVRRRKQHFATSSMHSTSPPHPQPAYRLIKTQQPLSQHTVRAGSAFQRNQTVGRISSGDKNVRAEKTGTRASGFVGDKPHSGSGSEWSTLPAQTPDCRPAA